MEPAPVQVTQTIPVPVQVSQFGPVTVPAPVPGSKLIFKWAPMLLHRECFINVIVGKFDKELKHITLNSSSRKSPVTTLHSSLAERKIYNWESYFINHWTPEYFENV